MVPSTGSSPGRVEEPPQETAMSSLKGTRTHENLKAAFAGESQANRRYLYFANKADVEGHPEIAALFRSTAEGETGMPMAISTTSPPSATRPPISRSGAPRTT